ncbi:MAG: 2OG-Fe(II) oxygenase [Phycisphaerae bacterium]|nr:2OG-Fe(II) oxygenase [Gemmatimonadaceae bacterium]
MTATGLSPNFSGNTLGQLELHHDPYPFLISREAIDPPLADELLTWLETGVDWHLHKGGFYEQWECDLLREKLPPAGAHLLSTEALSQLATQVGASFGADLSDRMTVIAHKLVGGQAIGVHNDDPDPGFETHRLVLQLNRRQSTAIGGELRVHGRNSAEDVVCVVSPVHNSAFGFEMSHRSWHSVAAVENWSRYTIIFSFWTKDADAVAAQSTSDAAVQVESATGIAASLSDDERSRLEQLTSLLQSLGAGRASHSDGNLLGHLVHTYLLLRSWQCSIDLATAGLFHSVYGTQDFHAIMLQPGDRRSLQQIIGEKAELAAYDYCACSKPSLHASLRSGPPYRMYDMMRNEWVELDDMRFRDVLMLDLANELEQQPRVQEEADVLRERRELFELAVPFMPPLAVSALRRAYQ